MSRSLTVITILAAVGPAASAPRLKEKPRGDYFPTMVGDRWVIEMRYESSSEEYTELITAVEKTDGGRVISVAREVDGKVDTRLSRVRVTDKGLFRISQNGSEYDAPYCILKRPLEPGDAWKTVASVANGASRMEIEYRVGKEEEVEVPAGKFRAVRIDCEGKTRGGQVRSVLWYDARVGVVKMEYTDADSGYVRVLKSFQPGKK